MLKDTVNQRNFVEVREFSTANDRGKTCGRRPRKRKKTAKVERKVRSKEIRKPHAMFIYT